MVEMPAAAVVVQGYPVQQDCEAVAPSYSLLSPVLHVVGLHEVDVGAEEHAPVVLGTHHPHRQTGGLQPRANLSNEMYQVSSITFETNKRI